MSQPSRYARRGRRDATQAAIAGVLTAAGWAIVDTASVGGGFPDLVALRPAKTGRTVGLRWELPAEVVLIEVKRDATAPQTPAQRRFAAVWPVTRLDSVEDALRFVGAK